MAGIEGEKKKKKKKNRYAGALSMRTGIFPR